MQNDAAMLQCSNEYCKAANHQTDKFCQLCATPLIKRYLWAVEEIEGYQLGSLVGDRYLLKSSRILLDTKPGLLPETPLLEVSDTIKPYLRLIPYQLHIPQVYGLVSLGKEAKAKILLLEQAPILTEPLPSVGLMPELTKAWKNATSMRQLNWLWQMATLWQPLWTEGVASSLLDPHILRIEGFLIRLLQLQPDQAPPTLAQLGQLWLQLVAASQPSITEFLEQLCHALVEGEIQTIDKLISILDRGLALIAPCVQSTITIATSTDKGPSRERNEDACYPASGAIAIHTNNQKPGLAIVCDGIGGHEGGNVASNLAIETIQQQIQQLPLNDSQLNAATLTNELERSARVANDKINQRNDHEHRHGRQRMGTTLVIALARADQMYITHVGDSRAYLITRTGCHQVTLDDDVAAREVRLGYALYREALQHSASGSLVQALGTSSSGSLHPTVQRFVIDEDCVFLLCSDGLSDYDRVEQSWEEILPIIDGKVDLATASQRLVEIGNTQNGHDNVTVALVHYQVKFSEPESKLSSFALDNSLSISESSATVTKLESNTLKPTNTASSNKTQLLPSEPASRRFFLPMLLGLVLVVSLGGGLLAYLSKQRKLTGAGSSPIKVQSSKSSISPSLEPQTVSAVNFLKQGALIQTKRDLVLSRISLRPNLAIASPQQSVNFTHGTLPSGSVLQVLNNQPSQQDYWLNLKVCSTPTPTRSLPTKQNKIDTVRQSGKVAPSPTASPSNLNISTSRLLQPQDKGWIRAAEIEPDYLPISSLESEQRFNCPVLTKQIGVRDQGSGVRKSVP